MWPGELACVQLGLITGGASSGFIEWTHVTEVQTDPHWDFLVLIFWANNYFLGTASKTDSVIVAHDIVDNCVGCANEQFRETRHSKVTKIYFGYQLTPPCGATD